LAKKKESRMIKSFGYHERFNDTLEIDVASIKKFNLPGATFDVIKDNKKSKVYFRTIQEGNENKTFVTITLKYKSGCIALKPCTASVEIDEIKFADNIYDTIINEREFNKSDEIMKSIIECSTFVAEQIFAFGYSIIVHGVTVDNIDEFKKIAMPSIGIETKTEMIRNAKIS